MRLVAIGDVGVVDNMIHIGDEAMFEEFVAQLRLRGATELTALSAAPQETSRRYGVAALHQVGFAGGLSRTQLRDRLGRVGGAARGRTGLLDPGDPSWAVIEAVRSADAVVVTGGGNLTSTWPANIAERVAVGDIARAVGTPLLVTGQTLGPGLTEEDAALVADLLGSAQLVGVREAASLRLARSLGVPAERVQQTIDDASFLAGPPAARHDTVAVTLSTHVGTADRAAFVAAVAELLDAVVRETGLDVLFVPHFASLDPAQRRGDTALHDAVAARLLAGYEHVTPTTSGAAAAHARSAALVLTSRYHPAVFAGSVGVPTVGIAVDDYTEVKLTGALATVNQSSVLPVADVLSGAATGAVLQVWAAREEIRARSRAAAKQHRLAAQAWWDRLAAQAAAGGNLRRSRAS